MTNPRPTCTGGLRYLSVCLSATTLAASTLETCSILSGVSENNRLDRQIDREEIAQCIKKLRNNKPGVCDGIVGELLKYGGSGMVCLLEQLFSVIRREELVPRQWQEGLIYLRKDPGNHRSITLLSVVGKVFCKILNNRLVAHLDRGVYCMRDKMGSG